MHFTTTQPSLLQCVDSREKKHKRKEQWTREDEQSEGVIGNMCQREITIHGNDTALKDCFNSALVGLLYLQRRISALVKMHCSARTCTRTKLSKGD